MRKPIIKKCKNCEKDFLCFRKEGIFCSRHCSGIKSIENIYRISFIEKFCLALNRSEIKNECWIWPKGKDRKGYGQFHYGKYGTYKAHRISYEIFNGEIPYKYLVCHTCDTPACCNPNHLWVGTSKDNTQDMMIKGRHKGTLGYSWK